MTEAAFQGNSKTVVCSIEINWLSITGIVSKISVKQMSSPLLMVCTSKLKQKYKSLSQGLGNVGFWKNILQDPKCSNQ